MTILVGVRCKEGVVVGTDSAATFVQGRLPTIEQTVKKLFIVNDQVIVAGTGEIGMGQRFHDVVERAWGDKVFINSGNSIGVARTLCKRGVEDFANTKAKEGTFGALVAFHLKGTFELCEFALANFQPELKTDHLWYVSMGSGQSIADPCLGFIRQAFWGDGMPNCQDGVFAVVWTLAQCIRLNPGGINEPMQVATLTTSGGKPIAKLLTPEELNEHQAAVAGAIANLRQFRDQLRGAGAGVIPAAPAPAPALLAGPAPNEP